MQSPHVASHPTIRILLAVILFTYTAQNMLNASVAPLARALSLPEWSVGAAVSAAALTVAYLSQFWGRRSVAWGPRRVILLALCCAFIASVLFSTAVWQRSIGALGLIFTTIAIILARGPFFGAAVAAIPPTGQALIAQLTTTQDERVRGMASFSGAINLSIMVGSVVSSCLGLWFIEAPVYAAPWFISVALVIAWVGLPRDNSASTKRSFLPRARIFQNRHDNSTSIQLSSHTRKHLAPKNSPKEASETIRSLPPRVKWHDQRVFPWILSAFGIFFTVGVMQITIGFVLQDRLSLAPHEALSWTAIMLLSHAAGAMSMQLIAVPRLGWSPSVLVRYGMTLGFLALLVLTVASSLWFLIPAMFSLGVASGLVGPGFTAGGSLSVSQNEQGGVAGVLNATSAVTWIFAPVCATALYSWLPLAPFFMALCVLSVSLSVAWTHPRLRTKVQPL
ncbi:MFS transporter [Schaalia sp. lx-260]|uniref:MFS transporter n=1 Tax=Schaalia sp. lx-260 TaxID=2899082 RepID=UPI001E41FECD|nr:MFS transporter [Schaalia sp. lx-260]